MLVPADCVLLRRAFCWSPWLRTYLLHSQIWLSRLQRIKGGIVLEAKFGLPSACLCCLQLSTDQVARALRVSSGALVQSVGPNSAAAKAGLLPTRRGLTGIVTGLTTVTWPQLSISVHGNLLSCCLLQRRECCCFQHPKLQRRQPDPTPWQVFWHACLRLVAVGLGNSYTSSMACNCCKCLL